MNPLLSELWNEYIEKLESSNPIVLKYPFLRELDPCRFSFNISEGHYDDVYDPPAVFPEYHFDFLYQVDSFDKRVIKVFVGPDLQSCVKFKDDDSFFDLKTFFQAPNQDVELIEQIFYDYGSLVIQSIKIL